MARPASWLAGSNTSDGIHLGLAFDYNVPSLSMLTNEVGYIFGGSSLQWGPGVFPPTLAIDSYLPFDLDANPQSIPGHNLAAWKARHPSWIVYRCNRRTPAYYGFGDKSVPLDFSNAAVREYELHEAESLLARGTTGVAFDDFTFANSEGRCGVYRKGVWTPLGYPGRGQENARYDNDMLNWLRFMSAQLRRSLSSKTITVNFATTLSGIAKLRQITPYIDMDFDESGFSDFGAQNLVGTAWQTEVDGLEYLNAHGKAFEVLGIVAAPTQAAITHAQMNWVLANYLLVKGAHSYTSVYPGQSTGFGDSPVTFGSFFDRPEYHIAIGRPTSRRYQEAELQLRNYSGGRVIVNPSPSRTRSLALRRTFYDMYGDPHASVSLKPGTAVVLLNAPPAGPSSE